MTKNRNLQGISKERSYFGLSDIFAWKLQKVLGNP